MSANETLTTRRSDREKNIKKMSARLQSTKMLKQTLKKTAQKDEQEKIISYMKPLL